MAGLHAATAANASGDLDDLADENAGSEGGTLAA
jgi:hypothetical protein